MPISQERLAEIAAIADEDIDTSDIPEAAEADFGRGRLVLPKAAGTTARPVSETATPRPGTIEPDAQSQPRLVT